MPSQAVPLPDGLLERLQSNSWNERFEAISQLEEYVISARPQTLSAHLQRVSGTLTRSHADVSPNIRSKEFCYPFKKFGNHTLSSAIYPKIAQERVSNQ